jgi:predicted phosphodiesterase
MQHAWRPVLGLWFAFGCAMEPEPAESLIVERTPGAGARPEDQRAPDREFAGDIDVQQVVPQERTRIAFFGDTGNGRGFEQVLELVRREQAAAVVHLGDFDYRNAPRDFFATVDRVLGPEYPFFAAVGNHDRDSWAGRGGYAAHLRERFARIGAVLDHPDLDDQMYSLEFRGVKLVFVGENGQNAEFARYLHRELAGDLHVAKICAWHLLQSAMQLGEKGDQMGWEVYETCRENGAIIATAHEHSYHRTRTLSSMQNQTVDDRCGERDQVCVGPGRTFAFVSGLGGHSIRHQARCLPAEYPYGCNQEWAFVYARDQGAGFGALFLEFNPGDPRRARGYFKNVRDEVVEEFTVQF